MQAGAGSSYLIILHVCYARAAFVTSVQQCPSSCLPFDPAQPVQVAALAELLPHRLRPGRRSGRCRRFGLQIAARGRISVVVSFILVVGRSIVCLPVLSAVRRVFHET